ncbi:restriction endonuclease subunit S [Pedosphaera parvula]|uniref:Restriction modification system DNA specificity domain protein n=1 Tax=Pedosphaera parvula (strain Ellin514) TaxID=320771 RepID=B9XT14_PEDPL|nr:restriction endonuclease subunit S [Pedosphaera parvula]EEF57024.1 restriction modification system DNA specificity domain protein [Pedosphaera parvula Ellin514]
MKLPTEWRVLPFGEVVEHSQYGISTPTSPDGTIPILGMKNINDGQVVVGNPDRVSITEAVLAKQRLKDGDLLFNRTNSLDLVGKTGLFRESGDFVCASYLVRFRLRRNLVDPRYVCYLFNTSHSQRIMRQLATKAVAQANINPTSLQRKFLLPLPPRQEQVAIADLLEFWDDDICRTESRLGKKLEFKRGLMQQLLTGQTQFKEFKGKPWRKLHLGDIVNFEPRVVPKPKGAFLAAGIRSHGKGVFLKRDFEAEDIALDELFVLRADDLVVNITFGWEGAAAIVPSEADGALVSHRFPTFTFKPAVSFPGYFRHVIKQKRFVHAMGLASPGGAGRNRVLSKTEFMRIPIDLPSMAEQERIATVLNDCDREIELLQKQLDALKEQKRGLMQKLLTGEIRVKAPDKI